MLGGLRAGAPPAPIQRPGRQASGSARQLFPVTFPLAPPSLQPILFVSENQDQLSQTLPWKSFAHSLFTQWTLGEGRPVCWACGRAGEQ